MVEATCAVDGCINGGQLRRGWCNTHYIRWRLHGDPLAVMMGPRWPEVCRIDGCDGVARGPNAARGLCRKHYTNWQRHGDPEAGAFCKGCGAPIVNGRMYGYCMRRECRSLYRAAERARDPQKARQEARLRRTRADKGKRRAAEARYRARPDRICVRPGCEENAVPGVAYCRWHNKERAARRYARAKLRLPLRLSERQGGMCPDVNRGGCGLPLGDLADTHVDHLIPIARNGPDDDWNLQLMHPECNLRKSDTLVPAALAAAAEHGLTLSEPDGQRRRVKPACLLT
jgi:5-methylcytosine-specific restriction endonuclease McrA